VVPIRRFAGVLLLEDGISLPLAQLCAGLGQKKDKKNPDTEVPGLIHTNEEGGGDIVTCCKNFR